MGFSACWGKSLQWGAVSGVATGWHGWTVSRGPGAKGAPKERQKKKKKKRKNRKEKKK